jgi:hypothetical protein
MMVRYNQRMSSRTAISGDQLTNALHTLGVHFVLGRQKNDELLHQHPALLVAALAASNEARLRLALIPLFLEHPEFATHARAVANTLDPSARLTLQCYYSAAVWLGQIHQPGKTHLPDHFSKDIGLVPTDEPEQNLRLLAKRHKEQSGAQINWLGTYHHAAEIWLKGLELQKA